MKHFGIGDELPTNAKQYRKISIVEMVKMGEPFTCDSREGHKLKGKTGDFLTEDGHGGFYPVSADFHAANYEECIER